MTMYVDDVGQDLWGYLNGVRYVIRATLGCAHSIIFRSEMSVYSKRSSESVLVYESRMSWQATVRADEDEGGRK